MPLPSGTFNSGPIPAQQINTALYGIQGAASGVVFHAHRPLLSETVMQGGTAYSPLIGQPVDVAGIQAYSVIDNTALFGVGADFPGTASVFHFQNFVPASTGAAGGFGGWWLNWNFPFTNPVTVPPGGVGAGMSLNGNFRDFGTFQYGATTHNNCPWFMDLTNVGYGSVNTWQPSFYWLTPSTPVINGNATDTAGQTTRMGWLWQAASSPAAGTVSAVPSVASSWGTVTSAMLNGMGSALTFLNNPPSLRVVSNTGQSVGNAAITILQFNTAPPANNQLDNYGGWSTAVSNYTAPLPGLYLFSPTTIWGTASSANDRWSGIQVTAGGTTVSYQGPAYAATPVGPGTTGTGLTATSVARILSLNAGDKVAAYGFQNSGGALSLYTGNFSRFIGAYMSPLAPVGSTVSYTAPVTGFRFQAGALQGTALAATLASRIGNDVNFLLNRPYFTAYQSAPQSGFADNSGFHQINLDVVGALPRGGNGDNWGGWSPFTRRYFSRVAGWYLVMADLYATPPAATTATLTAGILCSSSGGITPSVTPDQYQQVFYPVNTGGPPPGAFAMGLYYLEPNEFVAPMLQAQNWGGTWGTFVQTGSVPVSSQFSVFFCSELSRARCPEGVPDLDSALITFLSNAGIAGIIIVVIIAGWLVPKPTYTRALEDAAKKDAEIAKLQEALALERQRSNDATQAGAVTNQLISGLVKLAEHGHDRADSRALPGAKGALDLTGEDLGL